MQERGKFVQRKIETATASGIFRNSKLCDACGILQVCDWFFFHIIGVYLCYFDFLEFFFFQEVEISRPTAKRAAGKAKKSTGRVGVCKGGKLLALDLL